ncbi:methyltransferase [Aureibacter tunicatorum]|nr:methyltransferase [Aureibacter tunicatorum]
MTDLWLKKWDDRYDQEKYAYGVEPNEFFKNQLKKLNAGRALFAAEGEGRNAVFAAMLGWEAFAFDISKSGKFKAMSLAENKNVKIDYRIGNLPDLNFLNESFDVVALIYAHFPPNIKSKYHELLSEKLKKGGHVIFEAFGKKHLEYRNADENVGGPSNLDALFSIDELNDDFKNFEIILLEEKVVDLREGLYHNGKGSVVRFVGKKLK